MSIEFSMPQLSNLDTLGRMGGHLKCGWHAILEGGWPCRHSLASLGNHSH